MKAKREKMNQLMQTYCDGNYNKFARELDVDPSHLYRYMIKGIGGGKKLIGSLMKFCIKHGLDYGEYIDI